MMLDEDYLEKWSSEIKASPPDQFAECAHELMRLARLGLWAEKYGIQALKTAEPIVSEAFWDHYSAGNLPGSGYHHRVYAKVSAAFGWRTDEKFKKWKEAIARIEELVGGVK